MQIQIKIDTSELNGAFAKLLSNLRNTEPIRRNIGEAVLRTTRDRFNSGGPAPDGTPREPLSPAYLLTKKGKGILLEKNKLYNSLIYQLLGDDSVVVGANTDYARIHQQGGVIDMPMITRVMKFRKVGNKVRFAKKKHKRTYEKTVKVGPYKVTIPARPYLGISRSDEEAIKNIVEDHIRRGWGNTDRKDKLRFLSASPVFQLLITPDGSKYCQIFGRRTKI